MASQSEKGHAVNIANFKLVIDRCETYGTDYNPSNDDLTIANMTARWTVVAGLQSSFLEGLQNTKEPINERELLFKPLDKLVTRTVNYFKSTKASKSVNKDAKGLADKIRGFNLEIKKLEGGEPDPDSISKSHLSYVQRTANFEQLIYLFKSSAFYAPNEDALKIATLLALLTQLRTANDGMGDIISPLMKLRNDRNAGIYAADTGLIDVALACKGYVVGLYGARTPQARMVTGIRFQRYKI